MDEISNASTAVASATAGNLSGAATAIGIGLGSLVTAATVLRRRLSRDRVELTKDKAEGTFVELLLRERDTAIDEARQAAAARQADAATIARLTVQVEHLQRDVDALRRLLAHLHPDLGHLLPATTS